MKDFEVSVVMPCLNEEKTVGICVEKAVRTLKKLNITGEVVVSDNGSTDKSVEIALAKGARVVHQPKKGYGNAYLKGLSEAKGKFLIMADSDDTYDFTDLERFVGPLRDGYDMVMGTRLKGKIMPQAMPWLHQYIGNPLLSGFLRLLFKTNISDAHCGMRSFTKEAFEKMHLKTSGMEFASEMVINAAKANLKIKEIPITLYANTDRKPHLHSFRDGWRHLRFMVMYSPFHLFFIPGFFFLALGMMFLLLLIAFFPIQVGNAVLGPNSAILSSLFSIVGFQVLVFGYLARMHYLKISHFDKPKGVIKWMQRVFNLEKGIVIGLLLFIVGFIIDLIVLLEWIAGEYGELSMINNIDAIFGSTLIIIAIQVIFSSFLISLIQMGKDE